MSDQRIDPVFAAGLRNELIAKVRRPPRRLRWSRRLGLGVGAGVVVVGGGVAFAAGVFKPPGQVTNAPVAVSVLATHTGTATVQLGRPPAGANDVSLTVTCLTAGTFQFPGGGVSCAASDLRTPLAKRGASITVAESEVGRQITVRTDPSSRWMLQATYVQQTTAAWGVNARGETYGVIDRNGTPDLIAVDTGRVTGYIKNTDSNCASGGDVKNPSEAVAWGKLTAGLGISIPIYKSDGTTVVGTFVIGSNARVVPLSKAYGLDKVLFACAAHSR